MSYANVSGQGEELSRVSEIIEPVASVGDARYHYMDNLRALALLAGVILHAALSYSPLLASGWATADTQSSILIDLWVWFVHTFRMPLFFLIAGFFAHYLIEKRGVGGFLKNRALRLAVPFIVFWPIVTAAIIGGLIYMALTMPINTPVMDIIRLSINNPEAMNGQKPPITTAHLWFIYYLVIFCFATGLILRLSNNGWSIGKWVMKPHVILWIMPLLTALAIVTKAIPHPAPEKFIPELWGFAFFGPFFAVGYWTFKDTDFIGRCSQYWLIMLLSSVVAYSTFAYLLPAPFTFAELMVVYTNGPDITWQHIVVCLCTGILAWHMSLLCLVAARQFLNWGNSMMRYVADSSYWVYIMHLPVVMMLQGFFHTRELPIVIELSSIIILTLSIGFLSYSLLVRPTPIGWMLNGRKKRSISQDLTDARTATEM